MSDQSVRSYTILGLSILLGLTIMGFLLANAALSVKSLERTVTVKGLAEREVPANVATWPISFQVASNDFNEVFKLVESYNRKITKFLSGYGISGDDVSLSPPSVTDLHAQQWGDKQHIMFRYTAGGAVTVYSEDVDAVREAMANVIELGKQGVAVAGHPYADDQFIFTELSSIKPEMVEEATKNARAVAEKFAKDSNSRLGKIKTARQGQFSINSRDLTTPHIKKVRVVSTIVYYLSD